MTGMDFSVLIEYYPILLQGLLWTCILCVASVALSLIGSIPLALSGISSNRLVRWPFEFFI